MKNPAIFILSILASLPFSSRAYDIQPRIFSDTLKNGLRVLIVPDSNVAVVACRLYYFAGSMYECPGATGLSHMYEHMLFKGTKTLGTTDYRREIPYIRAMDSLDAIIASIREHSADTTSDSLILLLRQQIAKNLEEERKYIKKDEIWQLYENNGGTNLNAWTSDDMTAYYVTLPKNKIELFYWIESDRMRDPVLREFDSERDVVAEERRMRVDNRPAGRYWEHLSALFYLAHPYRNPTIGWMSDIEGYTRKKLENHVRRFYTPDNAVLVLSGNIQPQDAMKSLRRYFESIPRAAQRKEEVVTREHDPIGQTRFIVRDNAQTQIDMLFHIPGYPNNDLYVLDVVEGILSGRSGRLYKRLVDEEQLCTSAGASNSFRLHNGEFDVSVDLKDNADPAKVEKIIIEEIARLAREKPADFEMRRNKNQIRMSFVSDLNSLEGLANRLATFERLGSWKYMLEYPERIAAVKPADVPPIVKRYLDPDKMTIGILLKKK
jgi:predicted Zn-dependent peptidase